MIFQHKLYLELQALLARGEKLVMHQEEVGDRVCGLVAGYLLWARLVPYGPQAISVTERLTGRQLGGHRSHGEVEGLGAGPLGGEPHGQTAGEQLQPGQRRPVAAGMESRQLGAGMIAKIGQREADERHARSRLPQPMRRR